MASVIQSPFEVVSQNLLSIGALSIDEFLSSAHEAFVRRDAPPPDVPISAAPVPLASSSSKGRTIAGPTKTTTGGPITGLNHNLALHHTCLREFGETNKSLKFDLLEDAVDKKQCIITITRPDGAARSYKSEPVFRRKTDAKAQAARIAVQHGAIDFIMYGDSDELKAKKGVLLAPLEDDQPIASTSKLPPESQSLISEPERPMLRVREIEACCQEWRGDLVKPYWFDFSDVSQKNGAALKIRLAPHCYRVYSCEPTFDSPKEAQEHCAELAISENVLDFIRHGNGQTAPQSDLTSSPAISSGQIGTPKTIQAFYDSLPRPFEEPFGDMTAVEINAPGWLSNVLGNAKGARFTPSFHFLVHAKDTSVPSYSRSLKPLLTDLHGCLLRLKRPGECRSYLVEPSFGNPRDAKVAVCLLALSQGAGNWIREVGAAVEARITPEMRRFAQTSLFPTLAAETQRLCGTAPRFEFHTDGDGENAHSGFDSSADHFLAFGCTLKVNLKPNEVQDYSVPAEYRSKPDAKVAVAYHAAQEGVIDLLRGNDKLVPGYPPAFTWHGGVPQIAENPNGTKRKRKKKKKNDGGEPEGPPAKRLRTATGSNAVNPLPQKPRGGVSGSALLPQNPVASGSQVRDVIYATYLQDVQRARAAHTWNQVPTPIDTSDSRKRRSPSLEEGELQEDD
ncbi:hypothetical protein B0H19DRAFT_1248657 [Mycena capillaripes]|nr:hypothetical protein B0H19DRAFT_1248657 [Mycena capillaripes]